MNRYLLDTNVNPTLMRELQGRLALRIAEVGEASIYTSVVAAELRFGAAKRGSEPLDREVEAILGRMSVAPLGPPADRIYADLRNRLQASGTLIGADDLWIASHALQDGSVLVSDNQSEFDRVPDLVVENWVRT